MKHPVPNERMKSALFGDVHATAQCFLQIDEQPPGEPRRCPGTGLNQQIDVAVLTGVTPRKGTEHTHTLNAVLGRDRKDDGAFVLAQLVEGQTSTPS